MSVARLPPGTRVRTTSIRIAATVGPIAVVVEDRGEAGVRICAEGEPIVVCWCDRTDIEPIEEES